MKEFQNLMFTLGHELSDDQAEAAVMEIDTDRSGHVDFREFAMWWLMDAKNQTFGLEELVGGGALGLRPWAVLSLLWRPPAGRRVL